MTVYGRVLIRLLFTCGTPITPIVSSSPLVLTCCISSSTASTGTVEATDERW